MRLLFPILIVTVLIGCSSKKTVIEKEYINKTDTIIKLKDRFIIKPVNDTILIEKPCDSLGNLKPFKTVLKTSQGNVSIENKEGNIQAEINLDSIISTIEKEYQSKVRLKEVVNIEKVVKYRVNKTVILILIISLLINFILLKSKLPF